MTRKNPCPEGGPEKGPKNRPRPLDPSAILARIVEMLHEVLETQRRILEALDRIITASLEAANAVRRPPPLPPGSEASGDCQPIRLGRFGQPLLILKYPLKDGAEPALEAHVPGQEPKRARLTLLEARFLHLLWNIRTEKAAPGRVHYTPTSSLARDLTPTESGVGTGKGKSQDSLRAMITDLREKILLLGVTAKVILNIRGQGYALARGDDEEAAAAAG